MGYTVIHYFEDLQDFNHPYKVGDTFPRLGMNVTDARLKELAGSNNKQHKPLIKKVEEVVKEEKTYTKTEINRMSLVELKELAKREGIDNAEDMKGNELKKVLIDKFDL